MTRESGIGRPGFWILALLWLPAGVAATAMVRFGPETLAAVSSLAPVVPCGLPLALACRRLWRLGHRRAAWATGAGLGAVTVAAALPAGLLGPLAVAVFAIMLSLPAWIASLWLARRR